MFRKLLAIAGLTLLSGAAAATPLTYGMPTDAGGNAVGGANYNAATHETSFFIPFMNGHAGTFGVGGVGMSATTGTPTTGNHTGSLDLYLLFQPVQTGPNILSLDFDDLDISGRNDPDGFLESVKIFDTFGMLLAEIDHYTDPQVILADFDRQLLEIAINIASNPFMVKLTLAADSGAYAGQRLQNTVESLTATVRYIPEPSTLGLLAMTLLLLGGLQLRSRRRTA